MLSRDASLVFGSEIWSSLDRRVACHFAHSRPAISPAAVRHLAVLSPTDSGPMVCVAPFRSVSPPGPLRTGSRGMDLYTADRFLQTGAGGRGQPFRRRPTVRRHFRPFTVEVDPSFPRSTAPSCLSVQHTADFHDSTVHGENGDTLRRRVPARGPREKSAVV